MKRDNYLLQQRGRAEIIGEQTAGAANPGRSYPVNEWFEITVPNGRIRVGPRGGNWEETGVIPDVKITASNALQEAHARVLRRLIATATGDWRRTLERLQTTLETDTRSGPKH